MKTAAFSLLSFLLLGVSCKQTPTVQTSLNDTGVPLTMAKYRSTQVSDVHYNLSFNIPEKKKSPIAGRVAIHLTVHDLEHPVYLDFKEDRKSLNIINVNGHITPIQFEKEHVIIPTERLTIGKNTIDIGFRAGELSLNRNDDYLYTLLVPDRARTLFPCFDQPDIKAQYTLNITAPGDWEVLCGAPLKNSIKKGNYKMYQFATSDLMSTYLFSFVAGKFERTHLKDGIQPMTMLYRETNEEKVTESPQAIFDLHQSALGFLEDYTAQPYPFLKFDFATIPGFQYGGMEHTGAIQYRESSLFLDKSATRNQELRRAKLIAHETAHMWFGNLVTMEWFNDVWMKEVFANFMADKIVNPVFTDVNHDLQFLMTHYPRAYGVDRTQGSNPIRQELDNLNNAGSLYGSIIYNKAPIMMRQLEAVLGKTKFQEGIQEYIKTYANSNADWNGLVSILDTKTDQDLKAWSQVWVNTPGRPIILSDVTYENNHISKLTLFQMAEDKTNFVLPQVFEIALVYDDHIKELAVNLNAESVDLTEAIGLEKPEYILYNSNGLGYGVFPTDENVLQNIPAIKNVVSRGHAYMNSYENALLRFVQLPEAFNTYVAGLQTEDNEFILGRISAQIRTIFWNYYSEEQRQYHLPDIAKNILIRLESNASSNIKKTLFNLYQSIAYSEKERDVLYAIWLKKRDIDNLILNEDDYTRLAMTLALYDHPEASMILKTAREAISNPDRQKRFDFLEPALSAEATVRSDFFKAFAKAENREKENWVLQANNYIHHPLRQKEAVKDLHLSLELLEEIQQTGDIFFPKGWLDSTIGNYTTTDAYELLTSYVMDHPDLDQNLLRKLRQATDDLYRVQEVIFNPLW